MTNGRNSNNAQEPSEQLRRRNRFTTVAALVAAGFLIVLVVDFANSKLSSGLSTKVDIVQGLATTAGIVVAGVWAFYVFVLGRSFTANVHIQFALNDVIRLKDSSVAVVSVRLRNGGRTRVQKSYVRIYAQPIADDQLERPVFMLIPASVSLRNAKSYLIFRDMIALEPDEEAAEDVLFAMAHYSKLKVEVRFVGRALRLIPGRRVNTAWTAQRLLDLQSAEAGDNGSR